MFSMLLPTHSFSLLSQISGLLFFHIFNGIWRQWVLYSWNVAWIVFWIFSSTSFLVILNKSDITMGFITGRMGGQPQEIMTTCLDYLLAITKSEFINYCLLLLLCDVQLRSILVWDSFRCSNVSLYIFHQSSFC